jgi:GNAT superfamily N-acetyltransferase
LRRPSERSVGHAVREEAAKENRRERTYYNVRMKLVRLSSDRFDDTVDTFCDAFRDYPVMRYVIGQTDEYDALLRLLIGYFTESRFSRNYPGLGVESDEGHLVAAANIDPPESVPAPPSLERMFESISEALGEAAVSRYRSFAGACEPFKPKEAHYHLGMIGVIHREQGRGHARRLLDALHEISRGHPDSGGVSLTTETPKNLPFYERFGYRILGRGETPDGRLETWTLFRPDS